MGKLWRTRGDETWGETWVLGGSKHLKLKQRNDTWVLIQDSSRLVTHTPRPRKSKEDRTPSGGTTRRG